MNNPMDKKGSNGINTTPLDVKDGSLDVMELKVEAYR